jgi:hypothetical protein
MDPARAQGADGPPTGTSAWPLPSPQARPGRAGLRVLVTGVPIPGHVIPLLPLAQAILSAGDQVTFAIPASMADLVGAFPVLPSGPDNAALLAENDRRTGGADLADLRDIAPLAQLFAATRIDMTFDEALRHAHRLRPDVIVADEYDTIGPMLAAALEAPLVQHAIGLPISPPALAPAMQALLAPRYMRYGLVEPARLALLDPWPAALRDPHSSLPKDRLAIRPQPYTGTGLAGPLPLAAPAVRPRVLVTLGTVLLDGELLDALVDAVAALDVEVLALVPPGVTHPLADQRTNVRFLGFTPDGRAARSRYLGRRSRRWSRDRAGRAEPRHPHGTATRGRRETAERRAGVRGGGRPHHHRSGAGGRRRPDPGHRPVVPGRRWADRRADQPHAGRERSLDGDPGTASHVRGPPGGAPRCRRQRSHGPWTHQMYVAARRVRGSER